ncbi:MAG: WXG100 family type VII secretion target [bacterium]|nr:WXG100 family type VII secretion target [bacterium]
MNGAGISIDDTALQVAGDIEKQAESISQAFNAVRGQINLLPDVWHGQSKEAFMNEYESVQPQFNAVVETLTTISQQLRQVVQAFTDVDENLGSQLGSF